MADGTCMDPVHDPRLDNQAVQRSTGCALLSTPRARSRRRSRRWSSASALGPPPPRRVPARSATRSPRCSPPRNCPPPRTGWPPPGAASISCSTPPPKRSGAVGTTGLLDPADRRVGRGSSLNPLQISFTPERAGAIASLIHGEHEGGRIATEGQPLRLVADFSVRKARRQAMLSSCGGTALSAFSVLNHVRAACNFESANHTFPSVPPCLRALRGQAQRCSANLKKV